MGQGSFWIWAAVWAPWLIVVLVDVLHEPRDWRWSISAVGLAALAWLTWGRFTEFEGRLVVLAAVAILILLGFASRTISSRMRKQRIAAWAASNGFEAAQNLPAALLRLPFLAGARWPKIESSFEKQDGQFRVFDVITPLRPIGLNIGRGPNSATIIALHDPQGRVPFFQVRPRDLSARFDGGPLGDAIAMSRPTEFPRKYRLGGFVSRNLEHLFGEDVASSVARKPGWIIEGEGEWLIAAYFDEPTGLSLKTASLRLASADEMSRYTDEAAQLLIMIADRAHRRAYQDAGAA